MAPPHWSVVCRDVPDVVHSRDDGHACVDPVPTWPEGAFITSEVCACGHRRSLHMEGSGGRWGFCDGCTCAEFTAEKG